MTYLYTVQVYFEAGDDADARALTHQGLERPGVIPPPDPNTEELVTVANRMSSQRVVRKLQRLKPGKPPEKVEL